MTVEDVRRECEKRGWELQGPRHDRHPEQSAYIVITGPRRCSGRGETAKEAFLNACEREGVTPF